MWSLYAGGLEKVLEVKEASIKLLMMEIILMMKIWTYMQQEKLVGRESINTYLEDQDMLLLWALP